MKKTTKTQPMPQVPLGTAYNLVDALVAQIIERENARSPIHSSGYAYCTGLLSALLADAISKLPAKDGQEMVDKLNKRIQENI